MKGARYFESDLVVESQKYPYGCFSFIFMKQDATLLSNNGNAECTESLGTEKIFQDTGSEWSKKYRMNAGKKNETNYTIVSFLQIKSAWEEVWGKQRDEINCGFAI